MKSVLDNIKNLYYKVTACTYTIGFVNYSDSLVLDPDVTPDVHWVKGIPLGHWYADPFIYADTDDSFIVFVEDYTYKRDKAQISKIKVDKKTYRITEIDTVLRLDSHFSFPAFFSEGKDGGKTYIYPESCKTGKLSLYEYEQNRTAFSRILCPYPIADAVIFEVNGKKVISGTLFPNDNGKKLMIFPYYDNECPAEVQPLQTVLFKDNSARNAGMPIRIGDSIYRPAQNSNHRYGECVVIQKMEVDADNQISFHEVKRIYSPSRRYDLSFHTFNVYKRKYVVVDASGYRLGFLGRFLKRLSSLCKKFE